VLALDAQGASALQLACLYSDTDTVQLLLDSGAWLDDLASACMLNAAIAGNPDTMTVLCARGVSYSVAIDDAGASTLLHAAAAYGRLECVSLLLQHGCDVEALSSDDVSALDMVLTTELPATLKRTRIKRPAWSDRKATAALLLHHGADYAAYNVVSSEQCTELLQEYIGELREQNAQLHSVLSTHVRGLCSAAEVVDAQLSTTIRVQLVDAATGDKSKRVYTLDTALLTKLHEATAPSSASVLLSMLSPVEGAVSVDAHTDADDIKLLTYDGKLAGV
jgi:Ankyrin repeats (many copies)